MRGAAPASKAAHPAIASPGGLPDGTEKPWGEAATTQRDVVLEILAEGRTPVKLREIAENAAYHASEGVRLSLRIALDVPDAAERYLAGEPVFYGTLLPY